MRERTAIVALALVAFGCSEAPADRGPLEVGYCALRISLPLFVAEREGLFHKHGLRVRLRRYETAQPLVEELLDGRLEAGGYAALPIVLTAASRDGSRARFATAMMEDRDHPISALLRRPDESAIRSPADLRGRNVGILPTVAYRRWLEAILRHAGVDPADVRISPIAPPLQAGALAGGGVDALFTNDPMATAIVASGAGEPMTDAPVPTALGGPLAFGTFLLHPRFVRERPEDARRLIAALDEAIAFIEADQGAARAHMLPYVRASERPHVGRYPDARYLPSAEATDALFIAEARRGLELGIVEVPLDVSGFRVTERP